MIYDQWLTSVPPDIKEDTIWKMDVYRLALFVGDWAWGDVSTLVKDKRTKSLSSQLLRAVGSIGANISEGYSRRSGKDQARYYEYALGSAREARVWYFQARHVLSRNVAEDRIRLLTRIIQLLLAIIPQRRGCKIAETWANYEVHSTYAPQN